MLNTRIVLLLASSLLLVSLGSCGGAGSEPVANPQPGPAPGQAIGGSVLRTASGVPSGIQLTWTAQAGAAAYNIYKDAAAIPDSARGNAALQVASNVAATNLLDDFGASAPLIGETWFYRYSVVDAEGDESRLSPQLQLTITQHFAVAVDKTTAAPGDQVVITGQFFGNFDAVTDKVFVPGVVWKTTPAVGFVAEDIEAVVVPGSWGPTSITIVLPDGFTTGPLQVEIAGLRAPTPVVSNSAPYITKLTSNGPTNVSGDVTHTVTLDGANFGAAQDAAHVVRMAGADITAAGNYVAWSDTQIQFHPANLRAYTNHAVLVSNTGVLSNTAFFDLTNALPTAAATPDKTTGNAPLSVIFDASGSSDPEGTTLTYDWDWTTDGTVDSSGTTAIVTHQYPGPGTFNATLTVTDQDGGVSAPLPAITLNVLNPLPTVSVTSTAKEAGENFGIALNATATPIAPATTIIQYDWDFEGDGTFDIIGNTIPTENHVYPLHGVFRPVCRVTDDLGGVGLSTDGVVKIWSATDISTPAALPAAATVSVAIVNGRPAIAFTDAAANTVLYMRATDATGYNWPTAPTMVGNSAALIEQSLDLVDTGTCPAVVYSDAVSGNLFFHPALDRDGSPPWGNPVVAANVNTGMTDAEVLMVNGNPAIAFIDGRSDQQGYVRAVGPAGGVWNPQIAFTTETGDVGIDLAIIASNPAIAYCGPTTTWYRRAFDANGNTAGDWNNANVVETVAANLYTAVALTEVADPFSAARRPLVATLSSNGVNRDVHTTYAFDEFFAAKDTTVPMYTGFTNDSLDLIFVGQRPCITFGDGVGAARLSRMFYARGNNFNATAWGGKVELFNNPMPGTSVSATPFLNAGAVAYINQNDNIVFSREPDAAPVAYLIPDTIGFAPPPVTVNFDASASTDPDGTIADVIWDLKDARGVFSAGTSLGIQQATYNAPGNYNCTVTVVDNSGQRATAAVTIVVL